MRRELRFLHTVALLCLLGMASHARVTDLEQQLRDQYQGKTFLLRGFYTGDRLRYDATASPVGAATVGEWTVDGFVQLYDVRISDSTLKIRARRMTVSVERNGFQFHVEGNSKKHNKGPKKSEALEIEVALPQVNSSAEEVDAALSKVFLTGQDNFVDLVPDYWKFCVAQGLAGKSENCRFSPDLAAVPGVTSPISGNSSAEVTGSTAGGVSRLGRGVSPPRLIYQQEPEFSESARQAKYHGVVTLGLVVNDEGLPTKIHIVSPLGFGLDAKAVQAVKTWRFKPAEKDSHPVPAEIAVEVDFRPESEN